MLVFPQWQGYGAGDAPKRGALAISDAVEGARHVLPVPEWHALASEDGVFGLSEIAGQARAALAWLAAEAPERLLVIGGDCGSDYAPLCWQSARLGDALGVLYLDAHADLNTPDSSPTHRFHGMVLRAAQGEGALQELCKRPLGSQQILLAGGRDFDLGERKWLAASRVAVRADVDPRLLDEMTAPVWHVHLDLDVLDPTDFPESTVPTPGGPSLEAVTGLLVEVVARKTVASITITEHAGGAESAGRIAGLVEALRRAGWR